MELSYLDEVPGIDRGNRWPPNVSKYLLWQDPLLGLFDRDVEGLDLGEHGMHAYDVAPSTGPFEDAHLRGSPVPVASARLATES